MPTPVTFKVQLDQERTIAFTQRALFRMGSLEKPFDFGDLSKPRKAYAALVAWTWACLVPHDAADFPTPEDLAVHIPASPEAVRKIGSALADAVNSATAEPKNANSSTPGPSPASS